MKKILIIIMNYLKEEEVLSYAYMLAKQTVSDKIALVVVNNKKSDNCKVDLAKGFRNIKLDIELFDAPENLGYLNGAFYGYKKHIMSSKDIPNWIIVSNTDITIDDTYFFEKFLKTRYDDNIWCVAPSIYSPVTNSYQNPQYICKCSINKINRNIFIHRNILLAWIYSHLANLKAKLRKKHKENSKFVYTAHGSFFILKKDFFITIENPKYEVFMYSEEGYIAGMIERYGKKIFYDNKIEVTHLEGSTTNLMGLKKRAKCIADSLEYIRDEFYLKSEVK